MYDESYLMIYNEFLYKHKNKILTPTELNIYTKFFNDYAINKIKMPKYIKKDV